MKQKKETDLAEMMTAIDLVCLCIGHVLSAPARRKIELHARRLLIPVRKVILLNPKILIRVHPCPSVVEFL